MKAYVHMKTCIWMIIAVLVKNWTTHMSLNWWINKQNVVQLTLEQHGLNCTGPLTRRYFSRVNTTVLLGPCLVESWIWTNLGYGGPTINYMQINPCIVQGPIVYLYNGKILGCKKELRTDRCYNLNEPWKHSASWKKPGIKGHILYESIDIKSPK